MRVLKDVFMKDFDLAIFGLGYENRAINILQKKEFSVAKHIALGYEKNTKKFEYQNNKGFFETNGAEVFEDEDERVCEYIQRHLETYDNRNKVNCFLDITVMSRHRLASLICIICRMLPKGSNFTIGYSLSRYIDPSDESSPIRQIGHITNSLMGGIGSLNKQSSSVIGLGYEKDKALGLYGYLDSSYNFLLIPKGIDESFEKKVNENNKKLLQMVTEDNVFYYDVCDPYSTYVALKSLLIELDDFSRPLLVPLGPKIFAAVSSIIGIELSPMLPVWRVSSDFHEEAANRFPSGKEIYFTVVK